MSVLVGKFAPVFKAEAVVNGKDIESDFSLTQYKGRKYVVFFFYPSDFTFVCPTELRAFQERIDEFESRDCVVVGCSVDSVHSHWKWLQTKPEKGGIQGVTYPLVSDLSKAISRNYDVLAGEYEYTNEGDIEFIGQPVAYRGLFLIDMDGKVRHQVVNDLPLGRSVGEALRMLEALQFVEKHGEVCPANWQEGDKGIKPTPEGYTEWYDGYDVMHEPHER